MGVRNSRLGYGPGVIIENNNGCVVQMASCYNPHFSSQFQANNQSCFLNSNLLNMYKSTATGVIETAKFSQANFSCDLPRKAFMPSVANATAFIAPKQPQVGSYFAAHALHLPSKSISPFYAQSLVNLKFKNPIQFQTKFYRGGCQHHQTSIIPLTTSISTTPIPNQLQNHVHTSLSTLTLNHVHNHLHNAIQAHVNSGIPNPIVLPNQLANPIANSIPVASQTQVVGLANPIMSQLPKPNQVTLTNPQGIKFPMPLAYPYGQPLIENFNQAGLVVDENDTTINSATTLTTSSTSFNNNKLPNNSEIIVVNTDI